MSSMHTPAPWIWWTSNSWKRLKHDESGRTINVLEPYAARDGHPDLNVNQADMALIAAAPDLLALAKLYASECAECAGTGLTRIPYAGEASVVQCRDCANVRAVIAKAEGRS